MVCDRAKADGDIRVDARPGEKARLLKHDARQTSPSLRHSLDFDTSR